MGRVGYDRSIWPDNRLSAAQRYGPLQLPLPVLYAGGGRGKRTSRVRPLRGGVRGDRPGGGTLWRAEDPCHRRRAIGAPGDSGHLPDPAGHPGIGGTVSHHQRQPAAGTGTAPAGRRGGPAEHQPGHPAAGAVPGDYTLGDPGRGPLRHPGGGGYRVPASEAGHGADGRRQR